MCISTVRYAVIYFGDKRKVRVSYTVKIIKYSVMLLKKFPSTLSVLWNFFCASPNEKILYIRCVPEGSTYATILITDVYYTLFWFTSLLLSIFFFFFYLFRSSHL